VGNSKNSNGTSPCLGHANYIPFGCFISLVQYYTYASKKRPRIKTQIPMSEKSISTSRLLVRLLSPLNPCYSWRADNSLSSVQWPDWTSTHWHTVLLMPLCTEVCRVAYWSWASTLKLYCKMSGSYGCSTLWGMATSKSGSVKKIWKKNSLWTDHLC